MGRKAAVLGVLLLFNCTALQQQKSLPARPDDLQFHNLQVLPQNITRDELIATMRRFNQALGVDCAYCHVPLGTQADGSPDIDFRSDEKREKQAARVMIRMTRRINQSYVSKIPDAHVTVACWTCHRGESQPAVPPSLQSNP
jgi:hypothetical protein